jgi:acetyl-CoA carboxylase carboxyl transferase subunit alpha
LKALGLIDKIISEPPGGAHRDYQTMMLTLKKSLQDTLKLVQSHSIDRLLQIRFNRVMGYGKFKEVEL